jgi:hypothetical protein
MAPLRVSAQHHSPLHFAANPRWCDELMSAKGRELVMPSITHRGPIEAGMLSCPQ